MPFRSKKQTILPVVLDRRQVYIFPTRQGFVFILVLIAMLAGSINYNNNLGFLLVFLLGGIVLVSMIHTYRNLLGISVLSVSADPVFAGNDAVFGVFLRTGRHVRKGISLFAGRQSHTQTVDFPAGADKTISVSVPTHQRGILRPGSFTLSTVYPLGIFRAWAVLRPNSECTVYPFPLDASMISRDPDDGGNGRKRNRVSGPDDYRGLKTYQPGDSFRHIAWKALSRGQDVLTKDFDTPAGRSAILFDFSKVHADGTEERLSKLCAMILQANGENRKYGLALPGKTISPGSGNVHRHRCLSALALFKENESNE